MQTYKYVDSLDTVHVQHGMFKDLHKTNNSGGLVNEEGG